MEHPGRNKQQGPPPPGLEHPGTSGGQAPRTRSSGTEQGAGAAAPRTGSTGDKRRPNAADWIIRGGSSSRTRRTRTESPGDEGRPDAPDRNIRGRSGSRSQRTHDTIVDRHVAGRHPGLEDPGQNKKERPQASGPGKGGLPPRAGLLGADQPEGVPTRRARASRGKWRPEAKETGGRDQGGAAKETNLEATQRTTPRKCREAEKWTRSRRRRAAKMRKGPG